VPICVFEIFGQIQENDGGSDGIGIGKRRENNPQYFEEFLLPAAVLHQCNKNITDSLASL
jgi:hypothetical protein